jgi:site-specific DNA-methyltransferase (adenine-specific)
MDKLISEGVVVDAIITDPPYGTTACKWDSIIPFPEMWLRLNKLIKPNGVIVLFGSEPFSSLLRVSNLKMYKYDWSYRKQQGTGHLNSKKQPLRDFENISVFYSKQPIYNPQMIETGIKRKGIVKANRKNHSDSVYQKGIIGNTHWIDTGYRYPVTTLENMYDKSRFDSSKENREYRHPTQKPVALMEYLIKTYTNENELVLDFTMGSGTTGVACKNLNRKFIGIELDKNYFKIASERINQS